MFIGIEQTAMPGHDGPVQGPTIDHWTATRLPSLEVIRARLALVFAEGALESRSAAIAERAARSLFVFLYTYAVEGVTDNRVRPAMVTIMTDQQAARLAVEDRLAWWAQARRPGRSRDVPGRWYAENTREPIRDETFRVWKAAGALMEDNIATTSAVPRYRLNREFADLFDPSVAGAELAAAVQAWQDRHLTVPARARAALLRQLATTDSEVRLPSGQVRRLSVGPSTPLLKAAVEEFAPRFLRQPVVLVVTESRQRLVYEDAQQLRLIRLDPDPRFMPDLVLADLGDPDGALRFVLLECVATAGL